MSVSGAVSVATEALLLFKVTVRIETAPASIVVGLKALASVGDTTAATTTIKVALAGAGLFPLLVTRAPAGSVLR